MIIADPTTAGIRGTYQPLILSAVESSHAPIAVEIRRKRMKNSLYIKIEAKKIPAKNRPTTIDLETDLPPGAFTSDNLALHL
jgi:hypothetical protein